MSVIFVLCLCTCHIYLCATLNRWRSGRIRHQRLEDSPDNQVDSFYRITFPDKQQESVSFDSGIDQYDQTHRQWVLGLPLPSITGDIEAISAFVVREEKRFQSITMTAIRDWEKRIISRHRNKYWQIYSRNLICTFPVISK